MSMLDNITDEALLGDDDELDYDLEKDEEDALLADPDNYDDNNYEDVPEDHDENVDEQYDGQGGVEEESDVLDIDVNVALEEAEEDIIDQSCVKSENLEMTICKTEVEDCGSDQEQEEQKARDRFLNERNNVIKRSTSNGIPDTLDKVNVKPAPLLDNRNIKFPRGNRGRGRGRPNHGRGSVFGRVGTLPQEGKTVLINPHFRGNVQVNENARLVWDAANPGGHYQSPQRGYGNPQMAHVAPFQSQYNHNAPSPWVNPPFAVDPPNNNNASNSAGCGGNGNFSGPPPSPMHQQNHANFPEPPGNYGQAPELMNNGGIRPLMASNTTMPFNQQHHHSQPQQHQQQQNQMTSWNEDQCYGTEPVYPAQVGNFRGREVRYIQPLLAAPTFNNQQPQQQHAHFPHGRSNFNNNNTFNNNNNHPPPPAQQQQGPPRRPAKPYINPHHPHAGMAPPQSNYHQTQHFDQPPPYIQHQQHQQQFPGNQHHLPNHPPFQPQHNQQQAQPPAPPPFNQPPAYDSYENQGGFNGTNQYANHQYQSSQQQPGGMQHQQQQQQQQQSSPSHSGFQPSNNYQQQQQHGFENNFNSHSQQQQPGQGPFSQQQSQHYNNRQQFGQSNRVQNNNNHHHQQQQQQHQQQQQNHRPPMNNYTTVNRSPPKRRSFDSNQGLGDRDIPKKKKRSMEPGNLHEVPTVDMPDTTTEDKTESEDEETKAYRLKIEEQKRKREEFLRAKEERRKMAAAQRAEGGESLLGDAPECSVDISVSVKPKPLCAVTVKQQQQPLLRQPPVQQLQQGGQQFGRQHHHHQQQQQMRVRPQGFGPQQPGLIQHPPHFKQQQQMGFKQPIFRQPGPLQRPLQRVNSQQGVRRIPVQHQQRANNQRTNNLRNVQQQQQPQPPRRIVQQANIVVTQKNEPQQRVVLLKQPPAQLQKVQSNNRRVVLKGIQQQQQQQQDGGEQENLSSFLSNRKVVSNSSVLAGGDIVSAPGASVGGGGGGVSVVGAGVGSTTVIAAAAGGGGAVAGGTAAAAGAAILIETPVVVVSNLAAGTTDLKIRKLCQGLGPIQNIELIPNSRQATIRFKNIVSAHKFFKKYQRKIVDLSMIQVCLIAES